MVKKLMLSGCLVMLLGLSNIAFAGPLIFKVDFSCPSDANTVAGGTWFDFEFINGCKGQKQDWQKKDDVNDTKIDVQAGRSAGSSTLVSREGDPISNTALVFFDPSEGGIACADMQLQLYDLEPYTSYRVYTYHAWSDGNIASISILGAESNDVNVMPDVVYTTDDDILLAHPNVGVIDFTTGPDVGDGNAAPVLLTFDGCTRFNAFALHWGAPKASAPDPFDRERDVCPNDLRLSWTPVEELQDPNHDVYFGTDYDAVADANRTNHPGVLYYSEDQDSNEYPEDGDPPLDLELETTYYWRVDTVNEGQVLPGGTYTWRFRTEDGNAHYPSPHDYEVGWHPDANLSWTPACVATSQEVYLSTSFSEVNEMQGAAYLDTLPAGANTVDTPLLDIHTTYYWRVRSIGGGSNGDGHVWCFGTGYGGLVMYYKFNGTIGNDLPSIITDDSGNNIQFNKHTGGAGTVKYGEPNPVVVESSSSAEFNPDTNDPCFGYYRLDTGFNDPLLLAGPQYTIEVWFKVDGDYDPPADDDDMVLIGKSDGGVDSDDWRSWRVELDVGADADVKWYHSGYAIQRTQLLLDEWYHVAMVYDTSLDQCQKLYVNGGSPLEGNRTVLNSPDDHNTAYIGTKDNYDDGEFEEYGAFFAGMIDELRILDIALTPCEFLCRPGPKYAGCPYPHHGQRNVDANVVLSWGPGTDATSHDVYIGTDWDDVNDATTGSHPNVDYNNIDVNHYPADGNLVLDTDTMYYWRIDERNGGVYKGTIWKFETTLPVFDPNLRVWYKLDEEFGEAVRDDSGRYYEGDVDIEGGGQPDWDPNDGRFGGSLGFNNNTDLECGGGTLDTIGRAISVSVWLKDAYRSNSDNPVFSTQPGDDPCFIQALVVENGTDKVLWRVGGEDGNDVLRWNLGGVNARLIEGWHHWVFIKDEIENTMSIYFDAELVASNSDVNDTLEYIRGQVLRLGADEEEDKDFVGRIDDFRVYDKVLTDVNVMILFRGGDLESAWGPLPHDGAAEVRIDTDLVWRPGDYVNDVNGHDLYFGTDWDEVSDANSTDDPNVEYHNLDVNTYDIPYLLELGKTYYWRVDEVNDSNVWTGRVWRFTVAEYITIDDMEDYTSGFDSANPITHLSGTYGWDCGYTNQTGSFVDLVYPGSVYAGIEGRRSDQAMYYLYDSDLDGCEVLGKCHSEISNHFELDPNDWTIADVKMLSLWFLGDPLNDTGEQMYVGLEDTDTTYAGVGYGDAEDEDVNDIKVAEWQRWSIPLSSFTSVNLESVEKLYIGFGTRNGDVAGGTGEAYFDNIRLYLATCVLSKRPAAFAELDLYPDCVINFDDVEIMADEWLEADVNLGQVSEPCDANLVGWWKLDEDSGSDANDSSGNGHHGTIEVLDVNVWRVAGRPNDVNYALDFDGGRVRVLDHQDLRPLHQVSVSAWIKYSDEQSSGRVVAKGADDKETYQLEVDGDDDLKFSVRDGNDPNADDYEAQSDDDALDRDEWVHVAGTYDGNTVKCYVNGELAAENNDPNISAIPFLAQDTNDLAIGNKPGGEDDRFVGIIDDVRVYDYGLSQEEVRYLTTDGTGVLAMQSIANLSDEETPGDRVVNFKDFAILADDWLVQELYP
ncbi:MAG: LamG domain-containing protein [Planctomycetota bacterium]|jgi:hypothetical protein